jgi:DNA-binding NtrC family response regulator
MTSPNKSKPNSQPAAASRRLPAILVVDDEIRILVALERFLGLHNYRVLTATNAEDALEILDHWAISLVIADVKLHGPSGLTLLEAVGRWHVGVARIVLAGDLTREVRDAADDLCVPAIEKSASPLELLKLIRDELGARGYG